MLGVVRGTVPVMGVRGTVPLTTLADNEIVSGTVPLTRSADTRHPTPELTKKLSPYIIFKLPAALRPAVFYY